MDPQVKALDGKTYDILYIGTGNDDEHMMIIYIRSLYYFFFINYLLVGVFSYTGTYFYVVSLCYNTIEI